MPRTPRGSIVLSEEHVPAGPRRRRATRLIVGLAVAAVAVGGFVGVRGMMAGSGAPACRAVAMSTTVTFDPEQTDNAATITAVALRRGLPPRAATIAIATALQESKLRNLSYGDLDSVGLFQQRPSMGWGLRAQLLDPVYAANAFYDALVKVKGYESMEITKVAQAVQRSAAPEAYAQHETEGRVLASNLTGHSPGALGCRLEPPATVGNATSLQSQLQRQLGLTATRRGTDLVVTATDATHAWAVGEWAVAKAEATGIRAVSVGPRRWTRSPTDSAWSWQAGTAGSSPTLVVIHLA